MARKRRKKKDAKTFSRRDFLRFGSCLAGGVVAGGAFGLPDLRASSPGGDPPPPPVRVFRLSVRGRRGSKAAEAHNHFHLFACAEAADSHRAHPGDNSRVVSVVVSREVYNALFQSRGTSIADTRNLGRVEPFPLPAGGPKEIAPPEVFFRRGDIDGDGEVTINDPVRLFNTLFGDLERPACPDAADTNDNGDFEITDGIIPLDWLFRGRRAPRPPGPRECGPDPTPDALRRCRYDTCD